MNKLFFVYIHCFLLLFFILAQAELSFSGKMFITNNGGLRLQGIEKTGTLSGLRFKGAASISTNGDLIRTSSFYNQGSWLDNTSNHSGGLVFKRDGTAQVHISNGGTVRVREIIGYDVVIDLDVDADRDNDIDEDDDPLEDTWSKGPCSRGALVLPNCDDDGGNGYPDNWIGGDWDWNIGDEPANTNVDNAADLNDIAPLHLSKTGLATLQNDLIITLTVSKPIGEPTYFASTDAEDRVRIFLPSKISGNNREIQPGDVAIIGPENGVQAKFVKVPSNPDEYSYTLFEGDGILKFGVEGIAVGALIDIELKMENAQGEIGYDKVRLKVAPFALLDNTCAVNTAAGSGKTVIVEDASTSNDDFRISLRNVYGTTHLDEIMTTGSSVFHQDYFEIGYAKAPYGQLNIYLTLPNLNDEGYSEYEGVRRYVHNQVLKENVGVYKHLVWPYMNPQDVGGDIEAIPRANGNEPGCFLHGNLMDPRLVDFFIAQDVNPDLPINTSFLPCGHVDEVISVAPDAQRYFIIDPEVCWGLLVWADKKDPNAIMLEKTYLPTGMTVHDAISLDIRGINEFWEKCFNTTNSLCFMHPDNIPSIRSEMGLDSPESTPVSDGSNSGSANLEKGGAFIGFFPNNQKRYYRITFVSSTQYTMAYKEEIGSWINDENGLITDDCVFENARCFILKHWWAGTPNSGDIFTFNADPLCKTLEIPIIYGFSFYSPSTPVTNNSVNCLVDMNTVFTAKQFGPDVDYLNNGMVSDILEDYVRAMFVKVYSNVNMPDETYYHSMLGSIHCATNVQRVIPSYKWWDY
jgi:hypothetical protein